MEARETQRWRLRTIDAGIRDSIAREAGVSRLVASVLAARGFPGPEATDAFLNPSLADLPDPLLLPNMEAAVKRLARASAAGETVWVYADYDVDGVTSAAVLDRFFSQRTSRATAFTRTPSAPSPPRGERFWSPPTAAWTPSPRRSLPASSASTWSSPITTCPETISPTPWRW
jgi:hypothetical protein